MLTEAKPRIVYEIIETLLPQAVYSETNNKGDRLLELYDGNVTNAKSSFSLKNRCIFFTNNLFLFFLCRWGRKGIMRKGWSTVVQSD